ncbi:MAG: hypothetical protein LBQ36_08240 [Synergistaceae bacterium]|jgi:hypothetical protein|nr:hypothetical protein [Synergistaceae bacterium]
MARDRRRRWKGYVLVISILCGSFYFAEMRYEFFRLRDIETGQGNAIPEEVIWQSLPRGTERFWLSLAFGAGSFERKITNYYPVSMKVEITGWGKYRVAVSPLEIFLRVSWNSKYWWLSTDGRMWPTDLPAGAIARGLVYPNRPTLTWDSQLPLPIDLDEQVGDIYQSSLPMAKIARWYETIDRISWKKDIYCLFAKKAEGRQVVQILLGSEDRITGEVVVKDDASDWLSLAAALKNRYPGLPGGAPHGLSVNFTSYSDMTFTVSERRNAITEQ